METEGQSGAELDIAYNGSTDDNLAWNRREWGNPDYWRNRDGYGYQWSGGLQQYNSGPVLIAERFLLPHLSGRRDLKIMELAPGAGRFSVELARLSREMVLVDLNQACIEICRERFKHYPNFRFYTNDGSSLDVVEDDDFDLVATFDSMVHMAPEIVESYLRHFDTKVKPGGLIWMDHSGRGEKEVGKRTAVTADFVVAIAKDLGLIVEAQHFRNDHDCVSVFRRR